ncbi:MAG: ATP-binding protein, partial [Mogibacterium sp.]|nr:ATP-binding protein [Mogibacterium sp.]
MDHEKELERISEIDKILTELPPGSLVYKNINGKEQPYLQWTENGKQRTKYIKKEGREDAVALALQRKELLEERK